MNVSSCMVSAVRRVLSSALFLLANSEVFDLVGEVDVLLLLFPPLPLLLLVLRLEGLGCVLDLAFIFL